MIRKAFITVSILIATGAAADTFPEGINIIPLPVIIGDSLAFSLDDTDPISDELIDRLGLKEFPNISSHFTQYLPGKIETVGPPFLLLFFQSYTEEIFGWLLSYSYDGQVIDYVNIYYWNSEGFMSRTGSIDIAGTTILNEWLLDESGGTTSIDTISVMLDGSFRVNGSTSD